MLFGIHAKQNEVQMAEAKDKSHNKMRDLKSKKLILNYCTGESGDQLQKETRVLKSLTDQEPFHSKARFTIQLYTVFEVV